MILFRKKTQSKLLVTITEISKLGFSEAFKPETTIIYTHVIRKDLLAIESPMDTAIQKFNKKDKLEENISVSR